MRIELQTLRKIKPGDRSIAVIAIVLAVAYTGTVLAQRLPPIYQAQHPLLQSADPSPSDSSSIGEGSPLSRPEQNSSPASQLLVDFKDSDIKFRLERLMRILSDNKHEGWMLAAYPDPMTGRPLIGAGFNLDVPLRQHIQRNPLNPHSFIEPSTAQLWQAAGLDLGRLQVILDRFNRHMDEWKQEGFHKRMKAHRLAPDITQREAGKLLRVSTLQAVHNARAYCLDFDQLTASQQMALSQLVFQMGINLEEFADFLRIMNDHPSHTIRRTEVNLEPSDVHWRILQDTLVQSDWARRYTNRAITVIAMFDPGYDSEPLHAEREVRARIRPLVQHHPKHHSPAHAATDHRKPYHSSRHSLRNKAMKP